jgi:hypothetical protein
MKLAQQQWTAAEQILRKIEEMKVEAGRKRERILFNI